MDESQVKLESIGFTQAAAVSEGRVDAALDYVVNGPVQLRLAGQDVNVIRVSDYIDLPSNGLITNEQTIAENPELVQRVINADAGRHPLHPGQPRRGLCHQPARGA